MTGAARAFVAATFLACIIAAPVASADPLADASSAYLRGDYTTALRLFRALAKKGNAQAESGLGFMYDNGQGVPQDYAEALKWYRKAAEQGDASAEFNLGWMYLKGKGLPQDNVQAHMWLNLSAFRFSASEKAKRDRAAHARDTLAATMTPAQIAEAQKLAREWKPTK